LAQKGFPLLRIFDQAFELSTGIAKNMKQTSILKGRIGFVIGGLKQSLSKKRLTANQRKALEKAMSYFKNHQEWMKYDEYLKAGYPIGTGVVESSCGHVVKNRMEGTGRRWSVAGGKLYCF
jgi:hypothetical protein